MLSLLDRNLVTSMNIIPGPLGGFSPEQTYPSQAREDMALIPRSFRQGAPIFFLVGFLNTFLLGIVGNDCQACEAHLARG